MFVAVDEDGEEFIYSKRPLRGHRFWVHEGTRVKVSKGTIQRLLNYPLTWDDDCQEIVEYKDSNILKEDKVIKQNIKMRVTPEQSEKVQEICFENEIYWAGYSKVIHTESIFLYINGILTHDSNNNEQYFKEEGSEEIDAALFIRTNGSCEDTTLNEVNIDFKDEEYFKLEVKVFNLKKQLEEYVVKIANQKEEITRLLLQKEDLHNRWKVANRTIKELMDNGDDLVKQLEEKYIIIKYLENKLGI